jgi:hypothetical protein
MGRKRIVCPAAHSAWKPGFHAHEFLRTLVRAGSETCRRRVYLGLPNQLYCQATETLW